MGWYILTGLNDNRVLLFQLSREDSDVIWAGLREHQKYLIRRYEKFRPSIPDDSGDSLCKFVKTPNFIKDHLFKLSTRSFLLVFTQTNSPETASSHCIEFLDYWVEELECRVSSNLRRRF